MKWVVFRYCYYLLLLNVAAMAIGFALFFIKSVPHVLTQIVTLSVGTLINLYVYFGLIKYSYIYGQTKFRKIILFAFSLSVLYFVGSIVENAMMPNLNQKYFSVIFVGLETPLLFYAFQIIKTEDALYFKKLSSFYLYQFLAGIAVLIGYVASMSFPYSFMILLPFVIAGFVFVFLIWFWKIKLFKQLAAKYD